VNYKQLLCGTDQSTHILGFSLFLLLLFMLTLCIFGEGNPQTTVRQTCDNILVEPLYDRDFVMLWMLEILLSHKHMQSEQRGQFTILANLNFKQRGKCFSPLLMFSTKPIESIKVVNEYLRYPDIRKW
jgi:hypothetical protein